MRWNIVLVLSAGLLIGCPTWATALPSAEESRDLKSVNEERDRLTASLAQREEQMAQLQDELNQARGDLASIREKLHAAESSPVRMAASRSAGEQAPELHAEPFQDYPVKIYQVNREMDFIVLSVKELDWAKQGTNLLLANETDSIATAQVVEYDRAGFAIAQITHWMEPIQQIQKGQTLLARPVLAPGGQ